MNNSYRLTLQIANLKVVLETRDSNFSLSVPLLYEKFLIENSLPYSSTEPGQKLLNLHVINEPAKKEVFGEPLCQSEVWELWRNETGEFVFVSPRQLPPKRVIVDPNFEHGRVLGAFSNIDTDNFYPLSSIDIRIFATWLALSGDLILHASGIAFQEGGYCFIGPSGAGKSTLVESLMENNGVTVLGEDQVILRYIGGQFWIYGTPWHERIKMCSPIGVPLKKVFFLERGRAMEIESISLSEGMTRILQTAFVPYYLTEKIHLILDRLSLLGKEIPLSLLSYRLGSEILPLIIE